MEFFTQPRIALFITGLLVTLLIYALRVIGILSFLPGLVLIGLVVFDFLLLILALNPPRRFW
ncbi:hypothetical protein [Prochlorothrix hollandica]|uniref:Uncharacterized protein n=1 Tax=Prochlorothrix hollandica PCC 9006 = CALU 1027 TaxID=317619 RepID=A0A0M2PXD4_PROHO|nr:hypothetical protein [Prochlorothrix hollandica]KKJ00815.1 hypothetical protein PROH_06120 [Prochlorothrix hollandica PCC 9006 = CALU 1027]